MTVTDKDASLVARVTDRFKTLFAEEPVVIRSPGRVNLIGEHTDYNNGFVLPAAIDKAIYVAISKRTDNNIHLHAEEYNENYIAEIDNLRQSKLHWSGYVLGVVEQLQKRNYSLTGL